MKMRFKLKHILPILSLSALFISLNVEAQVTTKPTPEPLPSTLSNPNNYELLAPIPLDPKTNDVTTNTSPEKYIEGIFGLAIGIAGVIAVLKLIVAGFKYVTVENFSGKSSAKSDINNALMGLFLAVAAYTILATINKDLVTLNFEVSNIEKPNALSSELGVCIGEIKDDNCTQYAKDIPDTPDGTVIGNRMGIGCDNCVSLNKAVPQKPPGQGCVARLPSEPATTSGPCVVASGIAPRLYKLALALKEAPYNLDWQVTEMIPATATHKDDCHKLNTSQTGQCVDAALRSTHSTLNIIKFFTAISKIVGPNFQWEVADQSDKTALSNDIDKYVRSRPPSEFSLTSDQINSFITQLQSKIKVVNYATGEHAHINYP